ncbi:MAG TPA: hypothetical protein VGH89_31370 [Pseudonocardia sp.]|jgi:hypothetical protein
MKRLFWLGLGVATGVVVTRKAAEAAARLTPTGVGEQVGEGLRELASAIGAFGAEVRAGMTEREHELSDLVERRAGYRLPGTTGTAGPTVWRAPGPGDRD